MKSSAPDSVPARAARLWSSLGEHRVACALCAHRCEIEPGETGICGVRENREGKLVTLAYGRVVAASPDPVEKKPFFHVFPGTASFSIAAAGCNFRCGFCQNWRISQSRGSGGAPLESRALSPEGVVRLARAAGCRSISYTYTEPTIFFEYALDTAILARAAGMFNTFVTNGFMTAEALKVIRPFLDAANVDLKAFREETYRDVCGGRLQPVLDSIVLMRRLGIWVEATTLIVPGLNDGDEELGEIARFLAGVDRNIPWHISRFHPDYEYLSAPATPLQTLARAAEIGREKGLRFIYPGNIAGEGEPTVCQGCRSKLIRRRGFEVVENLLINGRCSRCGETLPGLFTGPAAVPIPL
ncbi:MAG: AmmeMemoRadiSam system radical SAM enzyme [Candidatus Aminicenantes bacterium]|nr:AmmeMemoRadiSam system radical SAM enzyme [Candidatus Aminicenantes bacterium]